MITMQKLRHRRAHLLVDEVETQTIVQVQVLQLMLERERKLFSELDSSL